MRALTVQITHDDPETEKEVTKALRMLLQAVALNDVDVKGCRVTVLDSIAGSSN